MLFRAQRIRVLIVTGCCVAAAALAQMAPRPAVVPAAQAEPLRWNSLRQETNAATGQETVEFTFVCTNVSGAAVVIDDATSSCGCTVPKLPAKPWIIPPHSSGELKVRVDLRHKSGTLSHAVTIVSTNASRQLIVTVAIPESPETARFFNQQIARLNRQLIFRGDCARCHAGPAAGKSGHELYDAVCGVCHDSPHRAEMVPDLRAPKHPIDAVYWDDWITNGRTNSLMPAFAAAQGGPLSRAQIDSLVEYLAKTITSPPATNSVPH